MIAKVFHKYVNIFIIIHSTICDAANILYVVPFSAKSHDIFLRPIGLELARRGHNVTTITSFDVPNSPENYHKIIIEKKELWDLMGIERPNIFDVNRIGTIEFINTILWKAGLVLTEHILNSTDVQDFLKKDNTFDVVISEAFVQEATYLFAHKYNAPLVLVTAYGNCMRHNVVVGNPLQLATIHYEFVPIENPLSFMGRLKNLYISMYEYFWWRFWFLKEHEVLAKKYFRDLPEPVPSLYELEKNAALFLVNRHFSFNTPMAYLPNIVEIGGLHTTFNAETVSLSKDIENTLNSSVHGVVYINFGSNVRSSELPLEKKNAFISILGRLKHTVLWKWEDDNTKDMPANVITRKWFPQHKILAHPNVKLFIGHGGAMSTQEAIYHGIPILGIPVYADQYNNLLLTVEAGFGKILQYNDIDETSTEMAIRDMLDNETYMLKAKEISKRFKDRPMNPLETAMFWIEYVIRNNGASYMKSPASYMHWIVYHMLDVYIFIAVIIAIIYKTIKILIDLNKILLIKVMAKKKPKQL